MPVQTPSAPDKGRGRAVETLEVEDEEQRQTRIHELFARVDSSGPTRSTISADRPFDFGDRKTFAVEPPAELLSRVQAFLPELVASNDDLAQRAQDDPTSVDIENVEGEQYIEMNLGLGVFEQRRGASSGSDAGSSSGSDSHLDDYETDSADEESGNNSSDESSDNEGSSGHTSGREDSTSSDGTDELPAPPLAIRPMKPLPRRGPARPSVVVLRDGGFTASNE